MLLCGVEEIIPFSLGCLKINIGIVLKIPLVDYDKQPGVAWSQQSRKVPRHCRSYSADERTKAQRAKAPPKVSGKCLRLRPALSTLPPPPGTRTCCQTLTLWGPGRCASELGFWGHAAASPGLGTRRIWN